MGRPSLLRTSKGAATPPRRERGRKEQSFTRNEFFRLANVRNNLLRRLDDATTQAGERERRAHDLQERSALDRVIPFVGGVRELASHELFDDWRIREIFERAPVFFGRRRVRARRAQNPVPQQFKIDVTIVTH